MPIRPGFRESERSKRFVDGESKALRSEESVVSLVIEGMAIGFIVGIPVGVAGLAIASWLLG